MIFYIGLVFNMYRVAKHLLNIVFLTVEDLVIKYVCVTFVQYLFGKDTWLIPGGHQISLSGLDLKSLGIPTLAMNLKISASQKQTEMGDEVPQNIQYHCAQNCPLLCNNRSVTMVTLARGRSTEKWRGTERRESMTASVSISVSSESASVRAESRNLMQHGDAGTSTAEYKTYKF